MSGPSSTPLRTVDKPGGPETIDLVPLLACVRFRGEVITRLDIRLARLVVSPLAPFAGWEIRRALLAAVHACGPVPADSEVVSLGQMKGHGVEAVRGDTGWTLRLGARQQKP